MKKGIFTILLLGFIMPIFVAGCGIESQEATFTGWLKEMDAMAARAPKDIAATIVAEKARFEERYKKLPAEEGSRSEGLGKLNQDSRAFIEATAKQLDDLIAAKNTAQKALDKAAADAMLAKLAGNWQGLGMKLTITGDGTVQYERLAQGVTKSISGGQIVKITPDHFDVKVLLATTTFKLNSPPKLEGGKWKMKVDGVELVK